MGAEQDTEFQALSDKAETLQVQMLRTPGGFVLAPARDGKVLEPPEFDKLSRDERKRIEATIEGLQKDLQSIVEQLPWRQKLFRDRVKTLRRDVLQHAIGHLLSQIKKEYTDVLPVSTYLQAMEKDILERVNEFHQVEESPEIPLEAKPTLALVLSEYKVNLLIDNSEIQRGTILIETAGAKIAQVNGLSVLQMADARFGQPSRITATVRLGRGDVIDIEREVELSGPSHSKGVMILAAFLGNRFAQEQPLSLAASLVFEQSYGLIDGDSASIAETCALLSALSGVPIRQGIAVTGSMDQHGQSQPIGGVNEKIEGFFQVCADRGLTGDQGVLIPESNRHHLMLRYEVVQAVESGKFFVQTFSDIDQAIEILTGVSAGKADEQGVYPPNSINALVAARLKRLTDLRMKFGADHDHRDS